MADAVQKQILLLALHAGEIMLRSGAETYRVEDTVSRICKAAKVPNADVFALPTGIFVTVDSDSPEGQVQTFVRRIKGSAVDLEKISQVNQFSRDFASGEIGIEEGNRILNNIDEARKFSKPVQILGAGAVAAFFTLMFGGSAADFACALVISIISFTFALALDKADVNIFFRDFLACALSAGLAVAAQAVGITSNIDGVIIGAVMPFLPGLAITNSVRDALSGDMVSACARALEAIITAAAIVLGAGVVLAMWVSGGGVFS